MTTFLLAMVSLFAGSGVPQDDNASERAIILTERMVKSIQSCAERVAVAQFKKDWVKETWGPPVEVKYDVERTNSLLRPFTAGVDFSLAVKYGKHHKTREAAAADNDLKLLLTGRYRNVYRITRDGNLLLDSIWGRGHQVWSMGNA